MVPALAKPHATLIKGMIEITFPAIGVLPQMMGVIGHLEETMVGDYPVHFFPHVRFDERCSEFGVIQRG